MAYPPGLPLPGQQKKAIGKREGIPTKVSKFSMVNILLVSADTEYSWQLPKDLRFFTLQVRDGTAIRIATEMDKVAKSNEPYFSLKTGMSWDEDNLAILIENTFLYFACSSTGKTIEIIVGVAEV